MDYELRDYQERAVDAVLSHFRKSKDPACVVLPTGAGKSLVIAEIAKRAKGRVLALAHVKELTEQNYEKQRAFGVNAGIFSAGLGRKETEPRVVFGSIQSVAKNLESFLEPISLLVIDECHRVSGDASTEYRKVIDHFSRLNPNLCLLGFTATPYRLEEGYIYERTNGAYVAETPKVFKVCPVEVTLRELVERKFLTKPLLEDAGTSLYDFSSLPRGARGGVPTAELNALLGTTKRVTESIVSDVVQRTERQGRRGVMLFAATVEHAKEVLSYLPEGEAGLVVGETENETRDVTIRAFKERSIRYLVNVSVLTTGFDAPHVDLIAILRPTESLALFQQMVGRGLRLFPGKENCLVIDYAGSGFSIFGANVPDRKPNSNSVAVSVQCPACRHENSFWGKVDADGDVVEHYGRRCQNVLENEGKPSRCEYRFRFKQCDECGAENDIAARVCEACEKVLVDPDDKLRAALGLRDHKVLRVSGMTFARTGEVLRVTYHDEDGTTLDERFDFGKESQRKVFFYVFGRRLAGGTKPRVFSTAEEAIVHRAAYPHPDFVVGRRGKKEKFFRVSERFFDYEGRYRKAF